MVGPIEIEVGCIGLGCIGVVAIEFGVVAIDLIEVVDVGLFGVDSIGLFLGCYPIGC